MKRIALIAPSTLPVPAVLSGGIEQGMTNVIDHNEKMPSVLFTVISHYHPLSKKLEKNYKYTTFINVKFSFVERLINYFIRRYLAKLFQFDYYDISTTKILKILKRHDFDLVHIKGNDFHIRPIAKVVDKEKLIYGQATLLLKKVDDFSLVKYISVGSEFGKKMILNHSEKVDEKSIIIRKGGIDTYYFSPDGKEKKSELIRKKYHIASKTPIICYLGRISPDKGIHELLKALIQISSDYDFKFIMIGSVGLTFGAAPKKNALNDTFVEKVMGLVEQMGDKCIMTGFVGKDELINYLASADIGVVPSIGPDLGPLTYLQFQAMGIPTIVTDSGAIPENFDPSYSIMAKRDPNLSVNLQNALQKLLTDNNLRKKMGQEALKRRDHLSLERSFNETINFYNNK